MLSTSLPRAVLTLRAAVAGERWVVALFDQVYRSRDAHTGYTIVICRPLPFAGRAPLALFVELTLETFAAREGGWSLCRARRPRR